MIKNIEGGGAEPIGLLLNVTKASAKEHEASLPFSRVIAVELAI